MPSKTSRLRERFPYLLAAAALVPAIWQAGVEGQLVLAGLSAALLLVNLAALRWQRRFRLLLPMVVNLLNAAVCLVLAWQATAQGKQWIQYAWVGAGVVFLVVAAVVLPLRHRRRSLRAVEGSPAPDSGLE